MSEKDEIAVFAEIASKEYIDGLAEKFPAGLWLDMNDKDARGFAKSQVSDMKKVVTAINRVRIDHKKTYGDRVDGMAKALIESIETASQHITVLVDEYKAARQIQIDAKKANDAIKARDGDHETALLMDEVETLKAEAAKRDRDDQIKADQKKEAERLEEHKKLVEANALIAAEKVVSDRAKEVERKKLLAESDVENRRSVNKQAVGDLLTVIPSLDRVTAESVVKAIARKQINNISINY